eukprot:10095821-Prorocentrum_lima.AAC.1
MPKTVEEAPPKDIFGGAPADYEPSLDLGDMAGPQSSSSLTSFSASTYSSLWVDWCLLETAHQADGWHLLTSAWMATLLPAQTLIHRVDHEDSP